MCLGGQIGAAVANWPLKIVWRDCFVFRIEQFPVGGQEGKQIDTHSKYSAVRAGNLTLAKE